MGEAASRSQVSSESERRGQLSGSLPIPQGMGCVPWESKARLPDPILPLPWLLPGGPTGVGWGWGARDVPTEFPAGQRLSSSLSSGPIPLSSLVKGLLPGASELPGRVGFLQTG